MSELKDINFGINQYCGPAVLSALTGESTDRCAAVISAVSGKKQIKGVHEVHLIEALKRLRFEVEETIFGGSTLYGTLHRMHTFDGLYVIFIPHHVVAIEIKNNEIYICDNHCKTPLDIRQSARLMQRVNKVIKVVPTKPPVYVSSIYEVDRLSTQLEITKVNLYENPKDNTTQFIGMIHFESDEELTKILNMLESRRSTK